MLPSGATAISRYAGTIYQNQSDPAGQRSKYGRRCCCSFMQVWQPRIIKSWSIRRLNPVWLFMSPTIFEFWGAGGGAVSLSAPYTRRDSEQIFSNVDPGTLSWQTPTTGPGLWTICAIKLAIIPGSPLRKFLIPSKWNCHWNSKLDLAVQPVKKQYTLTWTHFNRPRRHPRMQGPPLKSPG